MDLNFCKLKKIQKHDLIFASLKKLKKHEFNFLKASENSKNRNLMLCKPEKVHKT